MSRKKTSNTGWESDEEDLLGDGGISAFKAEDDEIDEEALLGLGDDGNYTHGSQSGGQDVLLEEQPQDELLDIGVDEADIDELVVEDDAGYSQPAQSDVAGAEDEEQEQLDYNDDLPQADEHVQVHYEEDVVEGGEGGSHEYADLSQEEHDVSHEEHDVSQEEHDAGIVGLIQDATTSYTDSQIEEVADTRQSESDSDSDSEKQGERGRFKSERPNIVSTSKAKSRTDIPDTLEVSAEQQAQLDKFPNGNKQRGRFQNNRGQGQQRGVFQRMGPYDNRGRQGERGRGAGFNNRGGPGAQGLPINHGQMMPPPGLMGRMMHPPDMSAGRMPHFRDLSPGRMMFRGQPDVPPQNMMHMQQQNQGPGPRPSPSRDFGVGQPPQRGPTPLFPPPGHDGLMGMQVRPPRPGFPTGQQQHQQQLQQQQQQQQQLQQQQHQLQQQQHQQLMGMQQGMQQLMGMQEQIMRPVAPAMSAQQPRPHNIHINPNFRGPGNGAPLPAGLPPQPLFSHSGVRMDGPHPLLQGQQGMFGQQQAMAMMGSPPRLPVSSNAGFPGQGMMTPQGQNQRFQLHVGNNQNQALLQRGNTQQLRGFNRGLSVHQRLQPRCGEGQHISERSGVSAAVNAAKRLSQQAKLTQQAKVAVQRSAVRATPPAAALKRQSTGNGDGVVSPKVPRMAMETPADAELRRGLEEQKRLREMIKMRKEEARKRQAEVRRKELEERLRKEGKTLADWEGEHGSEAQPVEATGNPVPQYQPRAQRISTVISRGDKKQTIAPTRRPGQQQQHKHQELYDQLQFDAQQTQQFQFEPENPQFPQNQGQFGSQQPVPGQFVQQQHQHQQSFAGREPMPYGGQVQQFQQPDLQTQTQHVHQQFEIQQPGMFAAAHVQPATGSTAVFQQQGRPQVPQQYPPTQQYPPGNQLAFQSPPPQHVQMVRPPQPAAFRPQGQPLGQQQQGAVRQQFQPRATRPQSQGQFLQQPSPHSQPQQQQQPDFPKPGEPMTNAQRIQLLNSGQSILGASRGMARGLVPGQVVSVISNRGGQALAPGRGQGRGQGLGRGQAVGRGHVVAGRGQVAAGRGQVTAGRGLLTTGRGLMTAGRGLVTAGRGLVTAGRGQGQVVTHALLSATASSQPSSNRTVLPVGRGLTRGRGAAVVSALAADRTVVNRQVMNRGATMSNKANSVQKVSIDNLARGTSEVDIRKLCETVGPVLDIVMIESQQKAIVTFDHKISAANFTKQYNRHMINLSMVSVTLLP